LYFIFDLLVLLIITQFNILFHACCWVFTPMNANGLNMRSAGFKNEELSSLP